MVSARTALAGSVSPVASDNTQDNSTRSPRGRDYVNALHDRIVSMEESILDFQDDVNEVLNEKDQEIRELRQLVVFSLVVAIVALCIGLWAAIIIIRG